MPDLIIPPSVEKDLKLISKKYPLSTPRIADEINEIKLHPDGDRYPGFGELEVRKKRMSLDEYKIGKRGGLRVIYLILPSKNKFILLCAYTKTRFRAEHEIKSMVIRRLKEILEGL